MVDYKLVNAVDYGVPQKRERVFIVGFRADLNARWEWPVGDGEVRTIAQTVADLPAPSSPLAAWDHAFIPGAREYPGHTGSDYYSPSKTIKAGAHGVPGGENMIRFPDGTLRYMTVHEAKLLQTFPSDYRICGKWGEALRQIGNAVPVELARRMGVNLSMALESALRARKRKPRSQSVELPGKNDQTLQRRTRFVA